MVSQGSLRQGEGPCGRQEEGNGISAKGGVDAGGSEAR